MSDNIRYDDEYFSDNEPNEKKERTPAKQSSGLTPEMLMKLIIIAVAVGAVIIVVLGCLVVASFNKGNSGSEDETTTFSSASDEKEVGAYTVTVQNDGLLNVRESASMEAAALTQVKNGDKVNVVEVVEAENIIWGKISANGFMGYVNMTYLVKEYSGTEVEPAPEQTTKPEENTTKPEENTTKPAETTTKPEENTTKPAETTTKPAETTTRPSSGSENAGFSGKLGTYTVDAQPVLNMRDGHDVTAESIAQIPDGAEVTVIDVYHDADYTDRHCEYWGKVTYQGITGWVAMGYLD